MTGIWAIDTGVSALTIGGKAVGIFGVRSAINQYHIGLFISSIAFLNVNGILIYYVFRGD